MQTNVASAPRGAPTDVPNVTIDRRAIYAILITLAAGNMIGRILAVNSVDMIRLEQNLIDRELKPRVDRKIADLTAAGTPFDRSELEAAIREELANDPKIRKQRPFLSANDRSRWATVRSLVEHGTYAIDNIIAEPNWDTIDMVQHKDQGGDRRLYSSKPPLLATLYAAAYWPIHKITDATLGSHPYEIGRPLLILFNVVPMLIALTLLGRMLDLFGGTDWGRIFVMAAACLGTFLTTFAVTLNNHLPAFASATLALYFAIRIWYDDELRPSRFFLAGLFAAFTVVCELPALVFFGLLGAALLWKHPRQTLLFGLPGAILVAAAYFGTNYLAHGTWRLPYAQRGDGPQLFYFSDDDIERVAAELDEGRVSTELAAAFAADGFVLSDKLRVRGKVEHLARDDHRRWVIEDQINNDWYTVRLAKDDEGLVKPALAVHQHNDWYDYEFTRGEGPNRRIIPSYWRNPRGIDSGEEDAGKYAFHSLIGHHGIFSLTPVFLLSLAGLVFWIIDGRYGCREMATLIAVTSVTCVLFLILRPPLDRNYGGMTSGFRWVFWMAPFWLLAALPAADFLSATRLRRALAYILLALSVVSVVYPTWNPWTYPWLTNLWLYMGWEKF
jgi:hypothetical protein